MKILIPNVTGNTNVGDQAILVGLISIIKRESKKSKIYVQSTYPQLSNKKVYPSLFHYLVISDKNNFARLKKIIFYLLWCLSALLTFENKIRGFLPYDLQKIIKQYHDSDLIVFVGGGYLKTKKGVTQSLNLFLQLLMIANAELLGKKWIVAPISIGPFAYGWQLSLVSKVLSKASLVCLREKISFELLKTKQLKNILLLDDTAFLIQKDKMVTKSKTKKLQIGFNIRNWYADKNRQDQLELTCVSALENVSKKMNAKIIPIIQVYSPDFPNDSDYESVMNVYDQLNKRNLDVAKPVKIRSVAHAKQVYGNLDLHVGMRLHSIIISAVQGVPFQAISYEHKSEGVLKMLDMEKYCISCDMIDKDTLAENIMSNVRERLKIKKKMKARIEQNNKNSRTEWHLILNNLIIQ